MQLIEARTQISLGTVGLIISALAEEPTHRRWKVQLADQRLYGVWRGSIGKHPP
jgi:hypothetical protein